MSVSQVTTLPKWLRRPVTDRVSRGGARNAIGDLSTVCEEARCPNRGTCFGEQGTATFLIMGPGCIRNCSFCSVTGNVKPLDESEPERVGRAAKAMGLDYVALTSTTRDDLDNGGASFFAKTVHTIHCTLPGVPVEVLVPDFGGSEQAVDRVLNAGIAVFGHNVETVPRLYGEKRSGADYDMSLRLLRYAADKGAVTKSALILGMGERNGEIAGTIRDLRESGVSLLVIGQYLRPTRQQTSVARYFTGDEFDYWEKFALDLGFSGCVSGPYVRSSFGAAEMYEQVTS
ncbi:MAG: lipoyl synthase [bacterium]|nr:lipoyl synthase [bacterium]